MLRTIKFNMHDILKDKVSGFKGQVLAITFYDTGCTHYGVAPLKVKSDGTLANWEWFDESRLVLVKSAPIEKAEKPHSGPDMNPKCR